MFLFEPNWIALTLFQAIARARPELKSSDSRHALVFALSLPYNHQVLAPLKMRGFISQLLEFRSWDLGFFSNIPP